MSEQECWPDDWPLGAIKIIEKHEDEIARLRAELEKAREAINEAHALIFGGEMLRANCQDEWAEKPAVRAACERKP